MLEVQPTHDPSAETVPHDDECGELSCGCTGHPVGTGGNEGALGRLTGYCPHGGKDAPACGHVSDNRERLERLSSSFELRARLRRLVDDERVRVCGGRVYTDPTITTEEYEDGSRSSHWGGIVLCNRAGCPVCGAAKVRRFHDDVLRTLSSGGTWQHVIFTVRHSSSEGWGQVYDRLIEGLRSIGKGLSGRIVMRDVEASIRATETTWSVRSGWHVHLHVLWKTRRHLLEEEKRLVAAQWSASTGASEEHGCRFGLTANCDQEDRRRQLASYLTKLAHEMSGSGKHAHPEHWTLGELYHRAAHGEHVDEVREYQRATKRRRLYQFDRRAKMLHDSAPELPERVVVRSWISVIDRVEFSGLSRRERAGDALALYLPIEVAIQSRDDPRDVVEDAIYSLLAAPP